MREPAPSRIKQAVSVAITLVLILVVALAAASLLGPSVGWNVNVVLSGSMEPAVHTGSVIITRPVAPDQVSVGDVIIFRSVAGERYTAHRVIAITPGPDPQFITKGDANRDRDPNPVSSGQLAGLLFLELPYLSYLFVLIRTPLGLAITIGIPALILLAFEVRKRWSVGEEG